MKIKLKRARVVDEFKVMCPHCFRIRDASTWALAHININITYTCTNCYGKSMIRAGKLGEIGGRGTK